MRRANWFATITKLNYYANNLVFWCHFLNKFKPWHTVYHYATITKHSNLNLIDRHQFTWLTVSVQEWTKTSVGKLSAALKHCFVLKAKKQFILLVSFWLGVSNVVHLVVRCWINNFCFKTFKDTRKSVLFSQENRFKDSKTRGAWICLWANTN